MRNKRDQGTLIEQSLRSREKDVQEKFSRVHTIHNHMPKSATTFICSSHLNSTLQMKVYYTKIVKFSDFIGLSMEHAVEYFMCSPQKNVCSIRILQKY